MLVRETYSCKICAAMMEHRLEAIQEHLDAVHKGLLTVHLYGQVYEDDDQ